MNRLDRIESALDDSKWWTFGQFQVADVRSLLRLAKASLHSGTAFRGQTEIVDEYEAALAALEEQVE
jgi:hypothetical protein